MSMLSMGRPEAAPSVSVFPDREHGFILDWKGNTAAYLTQREKGERL